MFVSFLSSMKNELYIYGMNNTTLSSENIKAEILKWQQYKESKDFDNIVAEYKQHLRQTFPDDVPRNLSEIIALQNIERHAKDFEIFAANLKQHLKAFQDENFMAFKGKKESKKDRAVLFAMLLKNCDIKIDLQEYPFDIFIFNGVTLLFNYDWQENVLYCNRDETFTPFCKGSKMSYEDWSSFIVNQIQKNIKLKLSKEDVENDIFLKSVIESHFNAINFNKNKF